MKMKMMLDIWVVPFLVPVLVCQVLRCHLSHVWRDDCNPTHYSLTCEHVTHLTTSAKHSHSAVAWDSWHDPGLVSLWQSGQLRKCDALPRRIWQDNMTLLGSKKTHFKTFSTRMRQPVWIGGIKFTLEYWFKVNFRFMFSFPFLSVCGCVKVGSMPLLQALAPHY